MKSHIESTDDQALSLLPVPLEEEKRQQIFHELDNILESRFFKSAARGKQFLSFIVQHGFDGNKELLKERTIGVEVFQRPHDYATGDDPVVRVQAGVVRRRLEQYYQATPNGSKVRIELPVGSYSPIFHWLPSCAISGAHDIAAGSSAPESATTNHRIKHWVTAGICTVLVLAAGVAFVVVRRNVRQQSTIEQFWNPIFETQHPMLICLAAPVVYRPYDVLFQRYIRTHPGTFQTEIEKSDTPLLLDPKEKILWGEMYNYIDYGVARGDTYAAVELSALFGKIGKPSQVRIGADYLFEDLRNSPSVVVGAFNNKWTLYLTSNLHFTFKQDLQTTIKEQTDGGQVWEKHTNKKGGVIDDTAIVCRLLNSKTGQFTIVVAGIGGTGTQAAAEFVTNPGLLTEGFRKAPAGWQTKNLEVVLQTTVTDSVPGPAHVVAFYSW